MSATSITLQFMCIGRPTAETENDAIYLSQPNNILYYTTVSIKLAMLKLTRPIKVKTIFYDVIGHVTESSILPTCLIFICVKCRINTDFSLDFRNLCI